MAAASKHIGTVLVWQRVRNSGRFGSGRKFITQVKVERPRTGTGARVVVDAYSVGSVKRAGPGSRATWFSAEEWRDVAEAVAVELGDEGVSKCLSSVKRKWKSDRGSE